MVSDRNKKSIFNVLPHALFGGAAVYMMMAISGNISLDQNRTLAFGYIALTVSFLVTYSISKALWKIAKIETRHLLFKIAYLALAFFMAAASSQVQRNNLVTENVAVFELKAIKESLPMTIDKSTILTNVRIKLSSVELSYDLTARGATIISEKNNIPNLLCKVRPLYNLNTIGYTVAANYNYQFKSIKLVRLYPNDCLKYN